MNLLLILLTMVILTITSAYVLMQDWRATTNRLFAFFTLNAVTLMIVGVLRLTGKSREEIWFVHGLTGPLFAISSWLLVWLILAIFIPHRYAQKPVRWMLAAPYLVMILFLMVDWYGGFGLIRGSNLLERNDTLIFSLGPLFVPVTTLYVLGGMLIPISMLLAVARRNRATLRMALWLSGGIVMRHPP